MALTYILGYYTFGTLKANKGHIYTIAESLKEIKGNLKLKRGKNSCTVNG